MDVGGVDRNRGRQGSVFPGSAAVVDRHVCGRLPWRCVDPFCQGSGPASVARVEWCNDGVFPVGLTVTAHPFPEVVKFLLEHVVLHFQSPTDKDLALEAKTQGLIGSAVRTPEKGLGRKGCPPSRSSTSRLTAGRSIRSAVRLSSTVVHLSVS